MRFGTACSSSITKDLNFLKAFKTSATLYYEGRSGLPYSYCLLE